MIENSQPTQEASPSISSNAAENKEVSSKTAKEQQENYQIENDRQALQNKLAFIVGGSMLKDVAGYLFIGSLDLINILILLFLT